MFNPILLDFKDSSNIKKGAMSLVKDVPTAHDLNISQELGKLQRIEIDPAGGSSLVIRSRSNSQEGYEKVRDTTHLGVNFNGRREYEQKINADVLNLKTSHDEPAYYY